MQVDGVDLQAAARPHRPQRAARHGSTSTCWSSGSTSTGCSHGSTSTPCSADADLDELVARIDLQAVVARLDLDQIVAKVDINAAARARRHRRPRRAHRARRADGPLGLGGDGADRRRRAQPRRRPRLVRAPLGRPAPAPRPVDAGRAVRRCCCAADGAGTSADHDARSSVAPGLEGHYAGIVTRFVAFVVDLVAIAVLFALVGHVVEYVLGVLLRHRFDLSDAGLAGRGRPRRVGLRVPRPPARRRPGARSAWRSSGCGRCAPTAATSTAGTPWCASLALPLSFLLFGFGFLLILLRARPARPARPDRRQRRRLRLGREGGTGSLPRPPLTHEIGQTLSAYSAAPLARVGRSLIRGK